ncbi:MAG: cytochrome P450 [Anaerolineae bacterium]|nr:MAG: cytochrome P450 [Anaerolineae bacterium]
MPTFNPHDPAFLQDPYPAYTVLRAAGPAFFDEDSGLWCFLNHADVDALLRDRRLGRAISPALMPESERPIDPPEHEPFTRLNRHSMFDMEPPEHTRLRSLVHQAFTPRRVENLRAAVGALCSELLDAAAAMGGMDVIEDFAVPLPVAVIAELLGVPRGEYANLRRWSEAIVAMYELDPTPETARQAVAAAQEFSDFLRRLAALRRKDPQDDLFSALALLNEEGHTLSEDELVATCVLLLNAGHEATVNVIGNGLWALLRHPEQMAALRNDPTLLPGAVEELLRWDTPLQLFRRWVLQDMDIHGIRLRPGDRVGLLLGAANRDPAVFARPDAIDIRRGASPHLAFGAGIHYCLGAPLARLELNLAFAALLGRFSGLRLAGPGPQYRPKYVIRGLHSLHVSF